MRIVLQRAIETLRERVGDKIDVEVSDFLAIHGKEDDECPRCGGRISTITYERSTTYFCRTCQPGLMVNKGRRLDLALKAPIPHDPVAQIEPTGAKALFAQ